MMAAFSSIKVYLLLGFALALVLGSAGVTYRATADHYERKIAESDLAVARQVADANAEAVRKVQAATEAADRQVAEMQKVARKRLAANNQLRKEVLRAKNGNVCVSSPPVRALIDGLRREQDPPNANPGGKAPGPSGSPGVRPAASSP